MTPIAIMIGNGVGRRVECASETRGASDSLFHAGIDDASVSGGGKTSGGIVGIGIVRLTTTGAGGGADGSGVCRVGATYLGGGGTSGVGVGVFFVGAGGTVFFEIVGRVIGGLGGSGVAGVKSAI